MRRVEIETALAAIRNPSKIAVAICRDPNDRPNAITLEWHMRTSIRPTMFAISIGHTRYSHECLQRNRAFNLVFPSDELREWAALCGVRSGRDLDKLAGIDAFAGRLCKLPIPRKALAAFECETVTQVDSGDHTIYVGEAKYAWLDEGRGLLLAENLFL
jgi:flavin reductase (DIM6/NTAB) family NADH-FMN oxidoreductase RutF